MSAIESFFSRIVDRQVSGKVADQGAIQIDHAMAKTGTKIEGDALKLASRGASASPIEEAVGRLSPTQLSKNIARISDPRTGLSVALATSDRGLSEPTAQALQQAYSVAGSREEQATVSYASRALGFPNVGKRYFSGNDVILGGRAGDARAQTFEAGFPKTGDARSMLAYLNKHRPAHPESIGAETKGIFQMVKAGPEMMLMAPLLIPQSLADMVRTRLSLFNRLAP